MGKKRSKARSKKPLEEIQVMVNGVLWTRVESLNSSGPNDLHFVAETSGDHADVQFGDGVYGAVPAQGAAIKVRYRYGAGASGDISAASISLLLTPPRGVASVTNPIAASGGADPEQADDVRKISPAKAAERPPPSS